MIKIRNFKCSYDSSNTVKNTVILVGHSEHRTCKRDAHLHKTSVSRIIMKTHEESSIHPEHKDLA